MLNVYVHLDVYGLPPAGLDTDGLAEGLCRELPDASLSENGDIVQVTLSQFALRSGVAARRQRERVAHALRSLGWPQAAVYVDDTQRTRGVRDDLRLLIDAARLRLRR